MAPETALRQNRRLSFLNLSWLKEPFLIKQCWAILHSRSVHLPSCLLVRKQQGIICWAFGGTSIFVCTSFSSQTSSPPHLCTEEQMWATLGPHFLSLWVFFFCLFIKSAQLSTQSNACFYPKQDDTAEYSSGLIWCNKTEQLQCGERIISLQSFWVLERHRWGWVREWMLEGECTKSNLEMTPFLYMFELSLKWPGCVAALGADEQYWNAQKQSAWKTRYIHSHVTHMGGCPLQPPASMYDKKMLILTCNYGASWAKCTHSKNAHKVNFTRIKAVFQLFKYAIEMLIRWLLASMALICSKLTMLRH